MRLKVTEIQLPVNVDFHPYSPRSHTWSVTWLDFCPNVSFSNKVVINQGKALRASQLFPFFYSPHKNSELITSKNVTSKAFFNKYILLIKFLASFRWWYSDWSIDWLIDRLIRKQLQEQKRNGSLLRKSPPAWPFSPLKLVEFHAR